MLFFAASVGWNEYLVTAVNMILNFVTEFLYQRFVVFGKSIDTISSAKEEEKEKITKKT